VYANKGSWSVGLEEGEDTWKYLVPGERGGPWLTFSLAHPFMRWRAGIQYGSCLNVSAVKGQRGHVRLITYLSSMGLLQRGLHCISPDTY